MNRKDLLKACVIDSKCMCLTCIGDVAGFSAEAISESRYNSKEQIGFRYFKMNVGDDDEKALDNALSLIHMGFEYDQVPPVPSTFYVDSRFLKRKIVLDFLKDINRSFNVKNLIILGDDYVLDEETYKEIDTFDTIKVGDASINGENIITKKTNKFLYNSIVGVGANPVDLSNSQIDLYTQNDFNITDDIIDEKELNDFVHLVNSATYDKVNVNIRFYNPPRALKLIDKLDSMGLSSKVSINMYAYPLVENSDVYESFLPLASKRNIQITYTCCHDLLNDYCHEPFAINNNYRSELEPGGKTDYSTYLEVLRFIDNFQNLVKGVNGNLEKAMMAYNYVVQNYDYDYDFANKEDIATVGDVDKVFNRDKIICVGYSNLFTLLCRRVGIPVFTYGAPGHQMNVGRIIEKDENGKVIFDKICTFDPTNELKGKANDSEYAFFGLDPGTWLYRSGEPTFVTLANQLAIKNSSRYSNSSKSLYNTNYYLPYSFKSFEYSMLRLMGYDFEDEEVFNDVAIDALQENDRVGDIPTDMLQKTLYTIKKREAVDINHGYYDDSYVSRVSDDYAKNIIDLSLDYRKTFFSSSEPKILLNGVEGEPKLTIPVDVYKHGEKLFTGINIQDRDVGPRMFEVIDDLPNGGLDDTLNDKGSDLDTNNANVGLDDNINVKTLFTEEDFDEGYIIGTNIRRPRLRKPYESDEDYIRFLDKYYSYYFANAEKNSPSTSLIPYKDADVKNDDDKVRDEEKNDENTTDEKNLDDVSNYVSLITPEKEPIKDGNTVDDFGEIVDDVLDDVKTSGDETLVNSDPVKTLKDNYLIQLQYIFNAKNDIRDIFNQLMILTFHVDMDEFDLTMYEELYKMVCERILQLNNEIAKSEIELSELRVQSMPYHVYLPSDTNISKLLSDIDKIVMIDDIESFIDINDRMAVFAEAVLQEDDAVDNVMKMNSIIKNEDYLVRFGLTQKYGDDLAKHDIKSILKNRVDNKNKFREEIKKRILKNNSNNVIEK